MIASQRQASKRLSGNRAGVAASTRELEPPRPARWLLRGPVAMLMPLLTLAILSIGLLPHTGHDLAGARAWLAVPADCPAPCWAGLQPGITPWQEALAALEVHPWVGVIDNNLRTWTVDGPDLTGGMVTWQWNGRQPAWLAKDEGGQLVITSNLVTRIIIPTRLALAELWQALGQPPLMATYPLRTSAIRSQYPATIWYFAARYEAGFTAYVTWTCPHRLHARWWQPARLEWRSRPLAALTAHTLTAWQRGLCA